MTQEDFLVYEVGFICNSKLQYIQVFSVDIKSALITAINVLNSKSLVYVIVSIKLRGYE